jgi:hypothetical protein
MGLLERFLALASVALVCWPARAHAEAAPDAPAMTVNQCLDAHEQAQAARQSGDLLRARAALRQCSAASCPNLVSRDCVSWLAEVEQQIPSVIFRATRDGTDLINVRIFEGDRELTSSITGTPLELEPGAHQFRAELEGAPPQQATYVLQAGDKGRVISFQFVAPQPAPVLIAPSPAPTPPRTSPSPEQLDRPVPVITYVLGGGALAAVITGGVLGGMALSEHNRLDESCSPVCPGDQLDHMSNLALAADISFVVAALVGGAALYTYVTRPSAEPPRRASLGMSFGRAGFSVAAGGSF